MSKKEFYFTFGQNHIHKVNGLTLDKDSLAVIKAEDESKAREIAFELFGPAFATSCPKEIWKDEDTNYFPRGFIALN